MTISSVTSRSVTVASSESSQGYVQSSSATLNLVSQRTADTADAAPESNTRAADSKQVARAVEQVNEAFAEKHQNLHAMIERDDATGISVVKVMDKETKEVVSQFPSKEILAIAEAIKQYQEDKGYLVDVNA
jgi:flagellar protein FlaG